MVAGRWAPPLLLGILASWNQGSSRSHQNRLGNWVRRTYPVSHILLLASPFCLHQFRCTRRKWKGRARVGSSQPTTKTTTTTTTCRWAVLYVNMLLGSWRAKFRLWSVTIPRDHQNITTLRPLLHLSPISSSRTHIVGISASPSPFFLTRSLVSSSSSTPKKRKTGTNTKTRTKTSKKVCDLPTVAIDPDTGLPLPPLPAFQTQTKSTSKLPQRGGGNSEDLEWSRLVRDGLWPDTALAREVYDNGKRFPTDLLLTRVGMFYEVSRQTLSASRSPCVRWTTSISEWRWLIAHYCPFRPLPSFDPKSSLVIFRTS